MNETRRPAMDDVESSTPDLTTLSLSDLMKLPDGTFDHLQEALERKIQSPGASISGYNGSATEKKK